MIYKDFADQFNKNSQFRTHSSLKLSVLASLSFGLLVVPLLFFIPSKQQLKIHEQLSPPSTYQASLNEYLVILENHNHPQTLPVEIENNLKIVAQNALSLSSESKTIYPDNQKLTELSIKLEKEIWQKFPDLIAQK